MKHYLPSAILKKNAREQLFGKLGTVIGAFLLHMLVLLPVAMIANSLSVDTPVRMAVYFIVSFIIELYSSILLAGEDLIYLKVACRQDVGVMDIFYGFNGQIPKIIGVRLIPAAILTVIEIPILILSKYMNSIMPDPEYVLKIMQENDLAAMEKFTEEMMPVCMTYLGVMLIYVIVMVVVGLAFSQTLFLMLDYPEKDALEIVKVGFKVMKGNWGRMLYVMLSFIPWYILGFMTCGISYMFSYAYVHATYANFYIDLMKNYNSDK